jgi:hypothetical protein
MDIGKLRFYFNIGPIKYLDPHCDEIVMMTHVPFRFGFSCSMIISSDYINIGPKFMFHKYALTFGVFTE